MSVGNNVFSYVKAKYALLKFSKKHKIVFSN